MDRKRVAKNLFIAAGVTMLLLAIGGYRFHRTVPALRSPAAADLWAASPLLPFGLAAIGFVLRRQSKAVVPPA